MTMYRDITRAVVKCPVCGVVYYPDNGDVCDCPETDADVGLSELKEDAVITTFQPD